MERIEILNKLTPIFREVFKNESLLITENTTISDIENWDSLSNFMLITSIEKAFSIRFRFNELNTLSVVGVIIDSIKSKCL